MSMSIWANVCYGYLLNPRDPPPWWPEKKKDWYLHAESDHDGDLVRWWQWIYHNDYCPMREVAHGCPVEHYMLVPRWPHGHSVGRNDTVSFETLSAPDISELDYLISTFGINTSRGPCWWVASTYA